MKILFISDVYFPRVNGVSTSIKTFIEQLGCLGHQVDLIAPEYGSDEVKEHHIKRVAARSIYFDPEDKLMKYGKALALLPQLKENGYDIVHIHTHDTAAGYLEFEKARVRWFLSINELTIPKDILKQGKRTYRSMKIGNTEVIS